MGLRDSNSGEKDPISASLPDSCQIRDLPYQVGLSNRGRPGGLSYRGADWGGLSGRGPTREASQTGGLQGRPVTVGQRPLREVSDRGPTGHACQTGGGRLDRPVRQGLTEQAVRQGPAREACQTGAHY